MADKDDKGLIGFDPLAWMGDEDENEPLQSDSDEESNKLDDEPDRVQAGDESPDMDLSVESSVETPSEISNESGVSLEATVNIQNVSQLYDRLVSLLQNQETIEIDASEVVSIDTASIQLLVVLKQETIKLGKEMSIDFPSEKFIEAAELLGVDEMLNLDQAVSGFF